MKGVIQYGPGDRGFCSPRNCSSRSWYDPLSQVSVLRIVAVPLVYLSQAAGRGTFNPWTTALMIVLVIIGGIYYSRK